MGSQSGMIQRFVPNLETLAHAVLSGRSKPALNFSVHTSRVVWLRAFGMTRVFDTDIGWQWSWFGHTTCEKRDLYQGSFVQGSYIGAFVHRQQHISTMEAFKRAIVQIWYPTDSDSGEESSRELFVDRIFACNFPSIISVLDALLSRDGLIDISILSANQSILGETHGLFHLYDEISNPLRLVWIGNVKLEGKVVHACAYVDQNACGKLDIFRP